MAGFGDGWCGFNLPAAAIADRLQVLAESCGQRGRDLHDLSIAVSVSDGEPEMLAARWLGS